MLRLLTNNYLIEIKFFLMVLLYELGSVLRY